jgi:hypothetical protein
MQSPLLPDDASWRATCARAEALGFRLRVEGDRVAVVASATGSIIATIGIEQARDAFADVLG